MYTDSTAKTNTFDHSSVTEIAVVHFLKCIFVVPKVYHLVIFIQQLCPDVYIVDFLTVVCILSICVFSVSLHSTVKIFLSQRLFFSLLLLRNMSSVCHLINRIKRREYSSDSKHWRSKEITLFNYSFS